MPWLFDYPSTFAKQELADLPLWLIHVAWPVTGVTWIAGELWHGTWEGDDADIRQVRGLFDGAVASVDDAAAEILDKLQAVLKGTPPPWLRKALMKDQEKSFDFEG